MDAVEQIKDQIAKSTVLLYMTGSPNAPQDGPSATAARAVMACGEKFSHVNVLQGLRGSGVMIPG